MAPNKKKKKKTVSNPARGFATVSQPSKPKITQDTHDTTEDDRDHAESSHDHAYQTQNIVAAASSVAAPLQAMSPEELEAYLENEELQILVESYATRCKQDASRQVNRLETECRQLRSQAYRLSTVNWLSEDCVSTVLQHKSDQHTEHAPAHLDDLNESTEQFLKLWTLKIVLETLKFPAIEPALEYLLIVLVQTGVKASTEYIWGLQEVLEWYAIEYAQQDLPDYDKSAAIEQGPALQLADDSDPGIQNGDHADTPPTKTLPVGINNTDQEMEQDRLDLAPLSATESEEDDPSVLSDRYIKIQTRLFDIQTRIDGGNGRSLYLEQQKAKLQKRIEGIQRDILFDQDRARILWQQALQELKIEAARSKKSQQVMAKDPAPEYETVADLDESEDILGGMFGQEEEITLQDNSVDQVAVRIVDFGKTSGAMPKKILEDCCHSVDKKSIIKFSTLVTTSYSTRQKVELCWSSGHDYDRPALAALPMELLISHDSRCLRIEMATIAAKTPSQAESYLSTVLMFILTHSGHVDHKQASRLLTVWRDLNTDLSEARRLVVNAADKDDLKALRAIVQKVKAWRHGCIQSSTSTQSQHRSTNAIEGRSRVAKDYAHYSEAEALSHWRTRSSSLDYQRFLRERESLPVHKYKELVLQEIEENPLTIICADTGAGKSTQIPSFILEHNLSRGRDARVLVTQPRRISAISLARRVSQELGERKNDLGTEKSLVGYAIRLESKTSKSTRITFATTGVLLRMIEASPRLSDLDYLILDEVHERTMEIDLLFIALKQLQQSGTSLKIVLMSATVDAQKFSNFFNGAPVVNIPGRTFPVDIRYLEDAIENTLDIKAQNGHLHSHLDEDDDSEEDHTDEKHLVGLDNYSSKTRTKLAQMDEHRIDYEVTASLVEAIATKEQYVKYSSAILIFMPGIAEIHRMHNAILARDVFTSHWIVHLLHSSFSTEDLEKAFAIPPRGYRKIVIATNIAETGITIPDITAVVDTCKEKIMRFDERRQLSRLTEGFISRSSARQRRGRAARVQEGLCFHLVTRHRFENRMLEQQVPEMLRLSLQDPILRVKIWNLGSIEDTLAAAIDPPTGKNIRRAIDKLKNAGALNAAEQLTPLGKIIAKLPLEVILSKLAVFGIVFQCLDAVLTIIAAFSSKSPFLSEKDGRANNPRVPFARGDSDLLTDLNAYQGWRKAKVAGMAHDFCRKHRLINQNLQSIEDQKLQLLTYLVDAGLLRLEHEEKAALGRARSSGGGGGRTAAGFSVPARYNTHESDPMLTCVIAMAFYPKLLVREGKGWRNVYSNQLVNLTSNSINRATDRPPRWLCFYEAMQTRSGALNVLETSKVSETVIVTVLGSAEFRFFSGVVSLDNRRMGFSVRQWRQLAAIKTLRESLGAVLDRCWQTPGLGLTGSDQTWIEIFANLLTGKDTKARLIKTEPSHQEQGTVL